MKNFLIFFTLLSILQSCSNQDNGIIILESFENGQPKKIKQSINVALDSYYEIIYDSLGRYELITPYLNGKKNGTEVRFNPINYEEVGLLKPYKNGKRQGYTYEFYKSSEGQQILFLGESKDDRFTGKSTWYHKNGNPSESGIRINDKKEGLWKHFYENGELKSQGSYLNGKKINDWVYFEEINKVD